MNADIRVRGGKNQTFLMRAVRWGDQSLVEQLLERTDVLSSLNAQDDHGRTALIYATIHHRSADIVKALIDAGAEGNIADNHGYVALHFAQDCGVITDLIDSGSNPNHVNNKQWTALHMRCKEGKHPRAVSLLLSRGADMDMRTSEGSTALILAMYLNSFDIASILVASRSQTVLDARNNRGETALFIAVQKNFQAIAILLLYAGASASIVDQKLHTPLMVCNNADLASKLLDGGIDINSIDSSGQTALFHACMHDREHMVRFLLRKNADMSIIDHMGYTALLFACVGKHVGIIDVMIEEYPTPSEDDQKWINAQDPEGYTALTITVMHDLPRIVEKLLRVWNVPKVRDNEGRMPIHLAASVEVSKILLEDGSDADEPDANGDTPLMYACADKNVPLIEFFMNLDSVNINAMVDMTALITAVVSSDDSTDPVTTLLSAKNPPDLNQRDIDGCTALHYATARDFNNIVYELLDADADVSVTDNDGCIPLMFVDVDFEEFEFSPVYIMVEMAPETVNHRDNRGRTALSHIAIKDNAAGTIYGMLDMLEDLDVAIDVNSKDNDDNTALHYAMLAGQPDTVRVLLEKGADILGCGLGDTTVLMKLFWDREQLENDFGEMFPEPSSDPGTTQSSNTRDLEIDTCIRIVYSHFLQRLVTVDQWAIRIPRRSGVRKVEVVEVDEEEEGRDAKRRRIE
jgi:ankyrin repeat protein